MQVDSGYIRQRMANMELPGRMKRGKAQRRFMDIVKKEEDMLTHKGSKKKKNFSAFCTAMGCITEFLLYCPPHSCDQISKNTVFSGSVGAFDDTYCDV